MVAQIPSSVLFCCDHNAIRSPMAEGMMKKFYGRASYVQSAGVRNDLDVDGFAVAVCQEIGIELSRHRARSFEEMESLGDNLGSFDLVVALSPASHQLAQDLAQGAHIEIEYWPIMDPTGPAEGREAVLERYRQTRDQIRERMVARFGPPQG